MKEAVENGENVEIQTQKIRKYDFDYIWNSSSQFYCNIS